MPYDGEQSSLLIILPNEIDGLAALEEKLKDPNALNKAAEKMYEYEVDVFLPKFKIETTTNLKEVLEQVYKNNDNICRGYNICHGPSD